MAKSDEHTTPRRRKTKTRRPVYGNRRLIRVLLLFIAGVIIVDGLVGDRGVLAMMRARQEYNDAAASITRQRQENSRLREEARRLREDPAAIEEIARRELGLIRRGEKVFIIKDVQPAKQ